MTTFNKSKGVTRLFTRDSTDHVESTQRFARRRKTRTVTTVNQKSVNELSKIYKSLTGIDKKFTELLKMKKINTMNMAILARVIILHDEKVKFQDGSPEFELKVQNLMEVFKKSFTEKDDEDDRRLKIVRLKMTMERYRIAFVNHLEKYGDIIKGSSVKSVFVD